MTENTDKPASPKAKKGKKQQSDKIFIKHVNVEKKVSSWMLRVYVSITGKDGLVKKNTPFTVYANGEDKGGHYTDEKGNCAYTFSLTDEKLESVKLYVQIDGSAAMSPDFVKDLPPLTKQKSTASPNTKVQISTLKKDWSLSRGLEMTLFVRHIGDNTANCQKTIRVLDASENQIGDTLCITEEREHKLALDAIPLNKIYDIIKYDDSVLTYKVEITTKQGSGSKETEKVEIENHEIPIILPAGSPYYGLITIAIRAEKHKEYWLKGFLYASSITALILVFGIEFASYLFALFSGLVLLTWFRRNKSLFRGMFSLITMCLMLIAIEISGDALTAPLLWGVWMAYLGGFPFYFWEEIYRLPNGESVTNFYPWMPIKIGLASLGLLAIYCLYVIYPTDTAAINPYSSDSFYKLKDINPLSILNNIPLLGHVDFLKIAKIIKWMTSIIFMILFLTFFGGYNDLVKHFRQKGGTSGTVGAGGAVGFIALAAEIWELLKDLIGPLFRGLRRKR